MLKLALDKKYDDVFLSPIDDDFALKAKENIISRFKSENWSK